MNPHGRLISTRLWSSNTSIKRRRENEILIETTGTLTSVNTVKFSRKPTLQPKTATKDRNQRPQLKTNRARTKPPFSIPECYGTNALDMANVLLYELDIQVQK
ncbi:hypothetical protein EJ08DRAFT_333280 [Tothia fuscella]|uniref:Uncharacterized protein n=1 Tax=Tothia fuscella TaxID=1048955 RepID=A0A9P4TWN8_9PEZI|nr:hypothetical protein EJ08DRAFT_333280 [Tothia fuscella]